jgi:hypothetical protein
MATIKRNFIVDISTATPRHWTRYRGLTSDGRRGLIIGGNYYRTLNVRIPEITTSINTAPLKITLVIGNADNIASDLCFDASNLWKDVTITRLTFADTPWAEGVPPVIASSEIWFTGFLGTPSFDDEKELVSIVCHANIGRRGRSPATRSRTLMKHHTPPPESAKLSVTVITQGS